MQCGAPYEADIHYAGTVDSHAHIWQECDCGLDDVQRIITK